MKEKKGFFAFFRHRFNESFSFYCYLRGKIFESAKKKLSNDDDGGDDKISVTMALTFEKRYQEDLLIQENGSKDVCNTEVGVFLLILPERWTRK